MMKLVLPVTIIILLVTAAVFFSLPISKRTPIVQMNEQLQTDSTSTVKQTKSTDSLNKKTLLAQKRYNHKKKPYIVIDRYSNKLYLRTTDSIFVEALCSTGSGGELQDSASGRQWKFETPSGLFIVNSKLVNPWWRKPDWAFIEEGLPVPKKESERYDDEMMGDYAIGFGDGYFIHGTIYERLLGVSVTHGCVRLGAPPLKILYEKIQIGTMVYVF